MFQQERFAGTEQLKDYLGTYGTDIELGRWIIIATGTILLFFGVIVYYSAIRFFGMVVGGIVGAIIALNFLKGGDYGDMFVMLVIGFGIVFGAIIGASLAMLFHNLLLFIAGMVIGVILFKMFALGLVTPAAFRGLTYERLLELIYPKTIFEIIAMVVGGVIYLMSAHFLIVVTMSLVGAYLIAWGFHMYILFPVLAPIGGIFQWSMTKGRRVVLVKRQIREY
jgi:hypothetical protein